MKPVGLTLDPTQFTIVRHVAIVDEFVMTNDDGTFVANVDERFIDRLVQHMNEREATTGDLCPIIIGHTVDGAPETANPVVGYLRNWTKAPFFDTGRSAAFADAWIMNDEVEQVRKFPRRSAEVWTTLYEADPLSLLGGTTPARDLGLMKLSRRGSLTYELPGALEMADDKKDDTKKSPESAPNKTLEDLMQQVLASLQQVLEAVKGPTAGAPQDKPGEQPPAPGGDEISDEELDKILNEGGQQMPADDKSRKGEPEPVKNMGYCGGNDTQVPDAVKKLQRDNETMAARLATMEVQNSLAKLRAQGFTQCDPEDAALVQDLSAMPADMRDRSVERLKLSRAPGRPSYNLDNAVNDPGPTPDPNRKVMTPADRVNIIKLAREKNIQFEQAAREQGFSF